ncbi:MAG: hypothetical protein ACLPVY_00655 [Acidimicrobiia bacterium]
MKARIGFAVVAVGSLLGLASVPVGAQGERIAPATSTIQAVPLRSSYETATRVVSRDIGLSVVLPDGHELWLFGDTGVYQRTGDARWTSTKFIDGSTALEAKYASGQVPHGGEYPSGAPARFIPVPNDVYLSDGSGRACIKGLGAAAFSARWPTGAAVMESNTSEVLITYSEVCVTHGGISAETRIEGWGYLLYNWRTHHIDHGPIDVFRPHANAAAIASSLVFGSPIFDNGNLTLFSSTCVSQYLGCGVGQVWSVTMPDMTAALDNAKSYTLNQLATDGSGQFEPLSISVGQYSTGLRMVEWTSIAGTYAIFSAPTITSAWHLDGSGTLPRCQTHTGFCFALEGHPELSTPTDIFVSYDDPDAGPNGHVVISALPD